MGLIDLLRRQHLHPDAEVRLCAVSRLSNQKILARMARMDPDARVRAEAGRRVVDASVLEELILSEPDLQARLTVIRCLTDLNAIKRLIGAGRFTGEVIAALVNQISDQQVLGELATTSQDSDVRLAAVRCLRDARAVSRLLQMKDLDAAAVEAFDGVTLAAALMELSNTQSLRELARITPFDRIRSEARRACEDLSRKLAECLSEDKPRPEYGWSGRIDKLLDQGADPNALDNNGRPAICVVAPHGYRSTIQRLLDLGADMNSSTPNCGPLEIAASHEREEIVKLLLEQPAVRVEDAFSAAQAALQDGKTGVAAILLKFLDTLKSEQYKHISALQVGATLVVVVEPGSYCVSILKAIESFTLETLGWRMTEQRELRHRWDHHVQDRTYLFSLRTKTDDTVAGHFMRRVTSWDEGIGLDGKETRGGVLCVSLHSETAKEAALQLVGLVRAIDEKAK